MFQTIHWVILMWQITDLKKSCAKLRYMMITRHNA